MMKEINQGMVVSSEFSLRFLRPCGVLASSFFLHPAVAGEKFGPSLKNIMDSETPFLRYFGVRAVARRCSGGALHPMQPRIKTL